MNNKILTCFVATALLTGCGDDNDQHRVVGELASDRIELTAESNEPITLIAVAEGERVSAGQLLLEQDPARARTRLDAAAAALAMHQARRDEFVRGPRRERVAAARAGVEGATQELAFRDSEVLRVRNIHARSLASAEELDRTTAARDAAQAELKLRLAQLEEMLSGTTLEELAQAEQAVKQAAAVRDAARIDLERHTTRAPVDGIVDSRLFETGERPAAGSPVMVLLGGTQPHARVYVPENLRVRIAAGTAAQIHVDGLDTPLQGRVRWIASEAAFTPYYALTERDRGRLSYLAKIDITTDRPRLPDGVPVEVELQVD